MRYPFLAFKERTLECLTPGEGKNKKMTVLVLPVIFLFFALTGTPASAETLQPWFHLSSVDRPGNLTTGKARSEVEQLTVSATGGTFILENPETKKKRSFSWDGTPEEVQVKLEQLYGAGNVEVSGGPGDEEGTKPYRIAFVKGLADASLGPIALGEENLNCVEATGPHCTGKVTVAVTVKGRPDGYIALTLTNVGDEATSFDPEHAGVPLTITDSLPEHLRAVSISGGIATETLSGRCDLETVSCTLSTFALAPFVESVEVEIGVVLEPGAASGEINSATVTGGEGFSCGQVAPGAGHYEGSGCIREGGGDSYERQPTGPAPEAHTSHPITVSTSPTPFAVEDYEMRNEEAGGGTATHAGAHPFQTTFALTFGEELIEGGAGEVVVPAALPKDLNFNLPAGFIGDPTVYPRCPLSEFFTNSCPDESIVGVASVIFNEPGLIAGRTDLATTGVPIFNVEPSRGEPARFAFRPDDVPVYIDTSVRTGSDYGITAHVENIPQTIGFLANTVTFWGVPGDPRHDIERSYQCLEQLRGSEGAGECTPPQLTNPPPLLSLPTSCTGPLQSTVTSDAWQAPGRLTEPLVSSMTGLDGCGSLQFGSEVTASPDDEAASTPTGLTVDVHVPQEEALNATGYAPAEVRNITVTLPEGLQLNPSAADGLASCPLLSGREPAKEAKEAAGEVDGIDMETSQPANCPDAAKIATATIKTPLLPVGQNLNGFVYLASPQNFRGGLPENPFSSLVAMYLVVRDPISGVLVKLAGQVTLSATGQITTTFQNNPQLPFEDAELHFFGGERAPLATPSRCGTYTTTATFEPWTNGPTIHEALHSEYSFKTSTGPNGTPCPGATLPFSPSLSSETTNVNAGSLTPLSTTISRPSGDQPIQSVTLHYPPGLSGLLSGVELCPEAQANAGTCGPNSQIGETIVSVGVGGDPFTVTGGKAYITEKYDGAPFGLSIVNPAKAGPFDLQEGRPVVVRAKIEINPLTAALTITTNPTGQYSIPSIIEGFALQIQHVNVLVNRPSFTFNPTSCNPTKITGTVNSAEGASSPVEDPFQVANCASLKFEPKLTASTSGKTSKADGASLKVDIAKPVAQGVQADIAKVKVELPKQLPSRLTTLQKACTAAQFDANPAGCPAASVVGHMKVSTPLVPVSLEGPMYFVSNGGEAFPNLIVVLQGYGITEHLVGDTFISKSGVTSSTFKAVPDVPFASAEVTLPEGKYSALGANGHLCELTTTKTVKKKLTVRIKGHKQTVTRKVKQTQSATLQMPIEIVAQDGAVIKQTNPVTVTGCPPTRLKVHKAKARRGKRRKGAA
jgi:hypothetical protein